MNANERRAYHHTWSAFQIKQEKYWLPKIYKALQSNNDAFAAHIRKNGATSARAMIDSIVSMQPIMEVLKQLYISVGLKRGRIVRQEIKRDSAKRTSFSVNDLLTQEILKYFELFLLNKSVIPITETQKEAILRVLEQGTIEGWGAEEMARAVEGMPYTRPHARLVVRTETVRASNAAGELEAQRSDILLDKEWISAHDARVRRPPKSRFDHWHLDGQVIGMDGTFVSGGEQLRFPGDPNGSAGNVCNCRCTTAYVAKRDASGRIMRRERPLVSVFMPMSSGVPVDIPGVGNLPGITVVRPTASNITQVVTI